MLAAVMASANLAAASEVTGTLSTGISSTVGDTVDGIVITAPAANPQAGTYTGAQTVTLSANGASGIRYTTDGTVPTCTSGNAYSGPISIGSSLTVIAISCYP